MSFELTNDRLQEIAIGAVTKFMNKEASLSEALAKEAQDLELNSDQIKRAIEATNTVAYLRQLEKSADRTFEFPLADYTHVMASMCLPDDMSKSAEFPFAKKDDESKSEKKDEDKKDGEERGSASDEKKNESSKGDKGSDDAKEESKDDEGEEEDSKPESEEEKQEKQAMLAKGLAQARDELGRLNYEEPVLYLDLVKAAENVRRDQDGLEKLAFVVEKDDLEKTIKLCGIEKRAAEDLVFTNKDLVDVTQFYTLYKQANEFVKHKEMLEDFVKRAEQVLFHKTANVEKLASIAGAIGGAIGAAAGYVGRGALNVGKYVVGKPFSGVQSFRQAAKAKGFDNVAKARSHYDSIKLNQAPHPWQYFKGRNAAKTAFNGTSPSLAGRVGLTGLGTALTGLGVDHAYKVKDIK